jgi:hypothetical protein
MSRYFYADTIENFINNDPNYILGTLVKVSPFDVTDLQRNAWEEEIDLLKSILEDEKGQIIFEYDIPRLGKRIDVVLLINDIVFTLEFKVNSKEYLRQDIEQVWDYALDLKNFHEASHNLIIVPVLIATCAKHSSSAQRMSHYDDLVFEPILCNTQELKDIIQRIKAQYSSLSTDLSDWKNSRYKPTPTIIQAASSLYLNHSVQDITRTEASGKSLQQTTDFISKIIQYSKNNGEKSICFVTGVPGAGKTLVGLNVAVQQFKQGDLAVYLSGNQPLVDVLTEALARDKKKQENAQNPLKRYTLTEARRSVKSFIQIVHHYRNTSLNKIKTPIRNGILEIDPDKVKKYQNDGYSEVEHVAIFDEAQRAWTQQQLANWLKRKQGIKDFPMSEPEFLIWSLDLREDWAVIICLVGGGQEINTGEAGISEWLRAINSRFPDWNVFISDKLHDQEYATEDIERLLRNNHLVKKKSDLHLAVSMRSFRAEQLSEFVHALLASNVDEAKRLYESLKDRYPIVLTRSLDKAKQWLKQHKRGSERYGLLVSSQAQRLRPLSIDVRCKPDTVHWFLDDIDDIRSSLFLEDAASEFDVQGLELDWTCIVWDGDLRQENNTWGNYSFTGNKWQNIRSEDRKSFQINAYRVLLTRARQGMIICVPEGNQEDCTRNPKYYDETFNYLKSIGLQEI